MSLNKETSITAVRFALKESYDILSDLILKEPTFRESDDFIRSYELIKSIHLADWHNRTF